MTRISGQIDDTTAAGARIALAILQEWISPADFAKCQSGADPHQFCDANIALYGAFAALHFAEVDAGSEADAAWLNATALALEALVTAQTTDLSTLDPALGTEALATLYEAWLEANGFEGDEPADELLMSDARDDDERRQLEAFVKIWDLAEILEGGPA